MNRFLFILITTAFFLSSCEKSKDIEPSFYQCTFSGTDSSQSNPHNFKYQALIDGMTSKGVVGITMAITNPSSGTWIAASGKADLHNNVNMQACNIFRVGSTVKTFTATTIIILAEEGKLNLDDKISKYLSGDNIDKIENANTATIRQLLQHSSGIYNYIQNLEFQTASLNNLVKEWNANELLRYAHNKKAYFSSGSDVRYSNTGYILLGLLIEHIEGKPFYEVFQEKIFTPLGLSMTQFAAKDPIPNGIVRGYIDLYSNLQVVESTYFSGWDYYTADGGLISNPYDLNIFMRGLFNGQLISNSSLEEMLVWQNPNETDGDFFPLSYGLGIFKIETDYGEAYMHSGDAIGYYANMLYFPDSDVAIAYTVNSNYGKIDEYVSSKNALESIFRTIFD